MITKSNFNGRGGGCPHGGSIGNCSLSNFHLLGIKYARCLMDSWFICSMSLVISFEGFLRCSNPSIECSCMVFLTISGIATSYRVPKSSKTRIISP